jgi:hypothetical protein
MQVRFGLTNPEFRVIPSEVSGWLTCNVGGPPSRRGPQKVQAGPGARPGETCKSHIPCSEPNSVVGRQIAFFCGIKLLSSC